MSLATALTASGAKVARLIEKMDAVRAKTSVSSRAKLRFIGILPLRGKLTSTCFSINGAVQANLFCRPAIEDLTEDITALVAQAELEAVWRRTKEALVVAKARGVKLGNPNGAESLRRAGEGAAAFRKAVSANAAAFAADLAPLLADIRAAGHTSHRAISGELKAMGIMTRRGGHWSVGNVTHLLRREHSALPALGQRV